MDIYIHLQNIFNTTILVISLLSTKVRLETEVCKTSAVE